MTDDHTRPPPSPGWRRARPDEIGLFGINSQDKKEGSDHQTLLDTKTGRLVFYGAMTFTYGSLLYIAGASVLESIINRCHKGRGI